MLLATSLLRIYQNYVLYGKYEIGDCIYVIVIVILLLLLYVICYCFGIILPFLIPLIICRFCLIGEYRIQTYLSSDFFPQ